MPALPSANFGQLTFEFSGTRFPAVCTIALEGIAGLDLGDVTSDIALAAADLHQLISSNAIRLEGVTLKQGPSDTGPSYYQPIGVAGEQGAASVTPNTSLVITKALLNVSGRRFGRMFWPGVSEGNVDDKGVLGPAAVIDFNLALQDFLEAVNAVVGSPVGGSAFVVLPAKQSSSDPEYRRVTELRCEPVVGTQRRRMRR